jgi:hypothetical protein
MDRILLLIALHIKVSLDLGPTQPTNVRSIAAECFRPRVRGLGYIIRMGLCISRVTGRATHVPSMGSSVIGPLRCMPCSSWSGLHTPESSQPVNASRVKVDRFHTSNQFANPQPTRARRERPMNEVKLDCLCEDTISFWSLLLSFKEPNRSTTLIRRIFARTMETPASHHHHHP